MMPADPGGMETVYLDGRFLAVDEARISPLDRGFLYGDGVFTTMRAEQGQVLYLSDHLERVHQSLQDLRLSLPLTHRVGRDSRGTLTKERPGGSSGLR